MRRVPTLALLFGLTASLAGCRHVDPRPLSAERGADELEGRTLADPGLREFLAARLGRAPEPWPHTHWPLGELTLVGLYFRSEPRVALAAAEVAGAHVRTAGERPNPTLAVLPQRAVAASGVSPWLAAVQLDWPIETAGKRTHRRAAAEARARAATLAVGGALWAVRGDVHRSAVALRAADKRKALLERARDAQRELIALLEQRLEAGAIAESVLAPQRTALLQASADLAAAERLCDEARSQLAAALGTPPAALDGVDLDVPLEADDAEAEALARSGARRAALLGRSDVRAMLDEYAAAEADLRLELAKQYPDLHVGPGYEFDQGVDKWGLALSVELPILSRNQGAIDEALARRSELEERFLALQLRVITEVDSAALAVRSARREREQARALVAEAEQRRALVERQLELGAVDRLGVLGADLEVARARLVRVDADERFHQALAGLEQAVEPPSAFGELAAPGPGEPETEEDGR